MKLNLGVVGVEVGFEVSGLMNSKFFKAIVFFLTSCLEVFWRTCSSGISSEWDSLSNESCSGWVNSSARFGKVFSETAYLLGTLESFPQTFRISLNASSGSSRTLKL